jgi:hypothetical protein
VTAGTRIAIGDLHTHILHSGRLKPNSGGDSADTSSGVQEAAIEEVLLVSDQAGCLGRGLLAAVAPDAVAADPVHARDAPGGAGDT